LLILLSSVLACTLVESGSFTPTQVPAADTVGWVGYEGRNVQIGAPAEQWIQVPLEVSEALEQFETLNAQDQSAANVFRDLISLTADTNYRLILMKSDGTAWLTIYADPLDIPFDEKINQIKQSIIDGGTQIYNERAVQLSAGEATRWETILSPSGSQIRNRQWQYNVEVGDQIYYLVFNAQTADFDDYAPTFAAMALIFTII
jgi:hypothetical protein